MTPTQTPAASDESAASAPSLDGSPPEGHEPPGDIAPEEVTPAHVQHLAGLARLECSEEEAEGLAEDLGRLLSYAQQLDDVDTAGVEPLPPGAPAVPAHLRPDDPEKPLTQREALENAPDAEDGFFQVPGAQE